MFADFSTLTCFIQIKIENNSILAEIPSLEAFFFRFDTYLHPVNKSLHRLQSFLKSVIMHMNSPVNFVSTC